MPGKKKYIVNVTLFQLVTKDVLSRKKRVIYATFGVVIGTMTVVAILTAVWAGKEQLYKQLEKYGPNLTIVPAVNQLDISLGNLSLGAVSVGDNYISEETIPIIREIASQYPRLITSRRPATTETASAIERCRR